MIKKLGIGIIFVISAVNLYGMEMQDPMETKIKKEESDEVGHIKEMPHEVLAHIVRYVTGLRVPQTVSAKSEYDTLKKGLEEAKKDINSLTLTDKYFKQLLDSTNKESWLHKQYKCELCQGEKPYTTAFYNALELHKLQIHKTIQWLRTIIQPLNNSRFHPLYKGAEATCILIAEKCVRVLAGLEEPSLVLPKTEDLDIIFRQSEDGTITYHEVVRREQAQLVAPQQFIETIDILEDTAKVYVDLTQTLERRSLKYITSTLSTIAEDIQALPGSASSEGKDKTLCGLIYYYYKDLDAGYLANFYRDRYGNLFFVDAQSEFIAKAPPTHKLNYALKDEVFFYPLPPKSGYYLKRWLGLFHDQQSSMVEDIPSKLHLRDEEAREQTDSITYISDGELSEDINIDQEESEENSIEDDISTGDLDNQIQKNILGHKRKRIEEE
jgi:hypothetical protein